LSQPDARMRGKKYTSAIGFYLFTQSNATGRIQSQSYYNVLYQPTFLTGREFTSDLQLNANTEYTLMPCTFDSGDNMSYVLQIYAEVDLKITQVQ